MKKLLLLFITLYGLWWMWGETVTSYWNAIRWVDLGMVLLVLLVILIILARLRNRLQMREMERIRQENPPQPKMQAQPQIMVLPPGFGNISGGLAPQAPKQATWTDLPAERYETL